MKSNSDTSDREIVLSRLFNAPRELVFDAWTHPAHVAKWYGPTGFTVTTHEMNFADKGVWRFTMHGPDGKDYLNKIVFYKVVRPERLEFSNGDDNGEQFRVTVTF